VIFGVSTTNADVYLQGPDISHRAYLQRVHEASDATTFTDWWLHDRKNKLEPQLVAADFEQAERAFLSAELKEAHGLYLNLAQRRHRFDWPLIARKKIYAALLRLAMMESEVEAKSRWLGEAIAFDPTLEPDPEIFPPPYIDELASLQESTSAKKISTQDWPKAVHTILINGREVPRTPDILIPGGLFRLTLLSDHEFPMSQIVDPKDLPQLRWSPQALVTGHCLQPQWTRSRDHYPKSHKVIFAAACDLPIQGDGGGLPQTAAAASGALPTLVPQLALAPAPRTRPPLWQNKWLWIGVGAVVGGTFVYEHIRTQNASPSGREGF